MRFRATEAVLQHALSLLTETRHIDPSLPFWHLQNDGCWVIDSADSLPRRRGKDRPTLQTLHEKDPIGRVPDDLWCELRQDPELSERLGRFLLEEFWPPDQRAVVAELTGFDSPGFDSLRFVPSTAGVFRNLAVFCRDATSHAERAGNLLRTVTYWIHDSHASRFAPSKFCAYAGMTFAQYEHCVHWDPVIFDGSRARKHLARLLARSFEPDPVVAERLFEWGRNLLGPDSFGATTGGKWRILELT